MIDPADRDQLETLLRRHRIDLKHSLGQNFMVDPAVRDRVADAAGATSGDEVLEVGAGAGALTVALAQRARRVVAVELDHRLIPLLREVVAGLHNVEVVERMQRTVRDVRCSYGQSLAVLEALIGQLFLVVAVGKIISSFRPRR